MDLKVIVPLHKYNDEIKELLINALNSVPSEVSVVISAAHGIKLSTLVKKYENVTVSYAEEGENTNFQSLVNRAVGGTEYFSILEYDDTYTPLWYETTKTYIDAYPELSVYMFMNDIFSGNDKKYIGFGNESVWAQGFSEDLGFVDNDCLKQYFGFFMTGSVFKTSDWLEIGGLKPSMTLTFWYEYLLRATSKGQKVYVIPKIGYNHTINREDSLTTELTTLTDDERKWWFETAQNEFLYTEDRNKVYEPKTEA